ncbi:hypothetical protein Bbelb_134270 [Branchiostoma belcheri]|nr:hypothetical protein Bbelb_134270 [Branchiostoma belcheri]
MAGDLIAHEVNPRHPGTTYIGGETVVCETSLARHIVRGTVRFLFSVTDDREGRVHRLWQCVTRVQSVPQQFSLYNADFGWINEFPRQHIGKIELLPEPAGTPNVLQTS